MLGRKQQVAAISKAAAEFRNKAVSTELSVSQFSQSGDQGFNILGRIRASKFVAKTPIGSIELGVSAFSLTVSLSNGKLDTESIPSEIDPQLPTQVSITSNASAETVRSKRRNRTLGFRANSGTQNDLTAEATFGTETFDSSSATNAASISTERPVLAVSHLNNSEFTLSVRHPLGVGEPINQKIYDSSLCYASPIDTGRPVIVQQTVQVAPKDVWCGSGTRVFQRDLSTNKRKIVNRLVAKLVDEQWKLEPFVVRRDANEK